MLEKYMQQKSTARELPAEGFDFGVALDHLRLGAKVCRKGWNGKGMFLFLVPGSTFEVNRPPLLGIYPPGTKVEYCPHVDMKTADNKIVPWLASQTDVLAKDWEVVGYGDNEPYKDPDEEAIEAFLVRLRELGFNPIRLNSSAGV